MSKTHLIKNTIKKYLYHYVFSENKIESSQDKAILEYFLSDDTIILSKKMLKKYIKVKELSDETLPPHLLRFEEIEEWKEEREPKPFVDIKIAKDRYVTVFSKKREIYLDLKIQQSYAYCEKNVEKFIKEWKQHEPLADDFFLTALENMSD